MKKFFFLIFIRRCDLFVNKQRRLDLFFCDKLSIFYRAIFMSVFEIVKFYSDM